MQGILVYFVSPEGLCVSGLFYYCPEGLRLDHDAGDPCFISPEGFRSL